MAIVVHYKPNGSRYILLGTGYGTFKAAHPSMVFGNLSPNEEEAEFTMVAVCNSKGNIYWVKSDELEVVDVDGETPAEILRDYN